MLFAAVCIKYELMSSDLLHVEKRAIMWVESKQGRTLLRRCWSTIFVMMTSFFDWPLARCPCESMNEPSFRDVRNDAPLHV